MRYNKLGFLVFLVSFGAAYGILRILGTEEEGLRMMIAGPLIALSDAGYRRVVGLRRLGDVNRGPAIRAQSNFDARHPILEYSPATDMSERSGTLIVQ